MKKGLYLAGLLVMITTAAVLAQPTVTLLTFESYTFADKFDTQYGTGKVQDGFQWGVGLEIGMNEVTAIEIFYQNLNTTAYYDGYAVGGYERYSGSLNVNYAMLGGTKYMPINEKISGFGSLDLGVGWFVPEETLASETVTKFSWGGRLGLRIMASEKVSLRIHAQLLSPVQWAGGGFYFGTGGSGAGVTTGSTVYQFNLGGSLNFRIK